MPKDLRTILVPEFTGPSDELIGLMNNSKPLIVFLVRSPTGYCLKLLSAFEEAAEKFTGRVNVFWIDVFENLELWKLFPGKIPSVLAVFCGGVEFGEFSCGESGPGVLACVDDALLQSGHLHAMPT